jgi:hypothetical protein
MRRRTDTRLRMPVLAGWLFADLFLMLFVLGLASLRPERPTPQVTPTPTPTPVTPHVLERTPVRLDVDVAPAAVREGPAGKRALVRALRDQLRHRHLTGRHAGFVLVFASGPTSGIAQAQSTAKHVIGLVRASDATFADVSGEGYWTGKGGDHFEFEVFFYG